MDQQSPSKESWSSGHTHDVDSEGEEMTDPEERVHDHDGVVEMMNAIERDKGDKRNGCFWKYMYGECNKQGCPMDHRDETIETMWKKKIWDIAKAVKSPGADTLVAELQRALRDAHSTPNANTRT